MSPTTRLAKELLDRGMSRKELRINYPSAYQAALRTGLLKPRVASYKKQGVELNMWEVGKKYKTRGGVEAEIFYVDPCAISGYIFIDGCRTAEQWTPTGDFIYSEGESTFWEDKMDLTTEEVPDTISLVGQVVRQNSGKPPTVERQNKNKPKLSLNSRIAAEQEARVWEFGLSKGYPRDSWKTAYRGKEDEVLDSLLRHAYKLASGEQVDEESGIHHAAHIRCNAAMLLHYFYKDK